jgi:hypothetical protein
MEAFRGKLKVETLSMNRFKSGHFKSIAIGVQVGLAKSRDGDDPKFYYHCAGSLISKTHVLTSARCVTEENSNKYVGSK